MEERGQSTSAYPVLFFLASATDHLAGLTGKASALAAAAKISKAGAAGASPSGAITEVDATNLPGWYAWAGHAVDRNTVGNLAFHASVTGADPVDFKLNVKTQSPMQNPKADASGNGQSDLRSVNGTALPAGYGPARSLGTVTTVAITGDPSGRAGIDGQSTVRIVTPADPLPRPGLRLQFDADGDQGNNWYTVESYADNADGSGTITLVNPLDGNVTEDAAPALLEVGVMADGVGLSSPYDAAQAAASQSSVDAAQASLDTLTTRVPSVVASQTSVNNLPTAAQIATQVELQILDEGDSRQVLTAIVNKINSVDADLSGLSIAAIADATKTLMEGNGAMLSTIYGKLPVGSIGDATEANAATRQTALTTALTALGTPMQAGSNVTVGGYATGQDPATLTWAHATWTAFAGKFSGLSSLVKALACLFRKSGNDATALGELNADFGNGAGTADPTTDSGEAVRDRGDAAWVTGGSSSGAMTDDQNTKLNSIYTSTGLLALGVRPIVTPVQTGTLTVIQGDSYLNADGNALRIAKAANAPWPTDLTGWTITVGIQPTAATLADPAAADAPTLSLTSAVVTATGDDQAVRFDLSAADSASLLVPPNGGAAAYRYDVRASSGSKQVTLEVGVVNVVEDAA